LPCLDIGDCGFGIEKNVHHIRGTYSIPIIDYNKRGEKTDIKSLRKKATMKKESLLLLVVRYAGPMDMMRRKEEYPLFAESSV